MFLCGSVHVRSGGVHWCFCVAVYTYVVEVYTGELESDGTDANVHLMLVGRRGDTGSRKLLKSLGFAEKKFQPGQVR